MDIPVESARAEHPDHRLGNVDAKSTLDGGMLARGWMFFSVPFAQLGSRYPDEDPLRSAYGILEYIPIHWLKNS